MHRILAELTIIRIMKGITQAKLAEEMDTSQWSVSHWESGKYSPTFTGLVKWVDALGYELVLKEKTDE